MANSEPFCDDMAHRLGVARSAFDYTPGRLTQTLHVPCARGHRVDFPVSGRLPPEIIAKKMMQKGWTIGTKLLCPEHSRPRTTKEPAVPTPEPAAPKPTPAAAKAKRLVYMALEENYDETKRAYRPGHSDKSIATTCDVAEALVKAIREEAFGPLSEPAEIDEFRASLAAFKKEWSAAQATSAKALTALEQRLDRLVARNGWAE